MDKKALYKLTYGLCALTVLDDGKDTGCIINTAIQCASEPLQISISVINSNHTCEVLKKTGVFAISTLPESAEFELYKLLGMQSGRDVDKFAGCTHEPLRFETGIRYLPKANAAFSCKVNFSKDLGSHTLFIADVLDAVVIKDEPSATYSYYQENVKPKPEPAKKGWQCKVCGYIYEGDELPQDFKCPLCKHGPEDFVKL